jgi:hypothetical protein
MAPARCIRAQYPRTVQAQQCFGRTVRAAGAHARERAVPVRAWQAGHGGAKSSRELKRRPPGGLDSLWMGCLTTYRVAGSHA